MEALNEKFVELQWEGSLPVHDRGDSHDTHVKNSSSSSGREAFRCMTEATVTIRDEPAAHRAGRSRCVSAKGPNTFTCVKRRLVVQALHEDALISCAK